MLECLQVADSSAQRMLNMSAAPRRGGTCGGWQQRQYSPNRVGAHTRRRCTTGRLEVAPLWWHRT